MDYHTNGWVTLTDGFTSHYWERIGAIIYAEIHNKPFLYTPIQGMAGNYNQEEEKEFISKKERFINLINHYPINNDYEFQKRFGHSCIYFFYNVSDCCKSRAFAKIKELFYLNKKKSDYFSDETTNIAVHMRKLNPHDLEAPTEISEDRYTSIIHQLRQATANKPIRFHIYSQGVLSKFRQRWPEEDIVWHINDSIEDTFTSMVFADVLVTCQSAFSRLAGYLSNGLIIYPAEVVTPQNMLPHFKMI
jgi:hypothetical protein